MRSGIPEHGVKRQELSPIDKGIADLVDNRLSYRKGWPRLPILPQWTCHDFEPLTYFPNFDYHRQNVDTILRHQGLPSTEIQVVHRLHSKQAKADSSTATLFMTAAPDDALTYEDAVVDIRKYLIVHDIDVTIELMDRRALDMHIFPLLPSQDKLFTGGREAPMFSAVSDILRQSSLRWVTASLVRRGMEPDQSECRPTLLVFALDASDDKWWDQVRPLLQLIVCDRVEIRQCVRFHHEWGEVDDGWGGRVATNDKVMGEIASW